MSEEEDRRVAEVRLALVDADVARWYCDDGLLSEEPLDGPLSLHGRELRERRLAAVAALGAAGGTDPHPAFLRAPTSQQRAGWDKRHGGS